jgi:hypothetical protein
MGAPALHRSMIVCLLCNDAAAAAGYYCTSPRPLLYTAVACSKVRVVLIAPGYNHLVCNDTTAAPAAVAACRKVRVVHIAPGYNHPSEDPGFEVRRIPVQYL